MAEGSDPKLSWWTKTALRFALKGLGSQQTLSLTDPSGWPRRLLGSPSATGVSVTSETAMRATTMWACGKILSESIGMLPIAAFEPKGENNAVQIRDHPVASLLARKPNADMDGQEMIEAGQLNLGLAGNAYHFRDDSGGEPVSLYPIPSGRVVPQRNRETREISYRVLEDGVWSDYPREKIWHVKGFGSDGLVGLSPIGVAREAFGLALATEEFQARFFKEGARPSATVSMPQFLKPDQRTEAREIIQQLLGGLENAHKVHLLEGGMKLEPWGLPLEDLQFVELRRFQIEEICRLFRIPPHMVGELSKATFSNIEQMSLEFVVFTLMPWLTRWERSAGRWLLSAKDQRKGIFLRFNFDALLRADSQGRAQLFASALQNGWMSRNEVRAKENLNRVDGLDDYTVQVNLTPVDMLGSVQENAAAARKPATPPAPAKDTAVPTGITVQIPERLETSLKQPAVGTLAVAVGALAESMAKERVALEDRIADVVEVVAGLATSMKSGDAASDERLGRLAAAVTDLARTSRTTGEKTDERVADLASQISGLATTIAKPRKIVINNDGEPIGTRLVDRL